MREILAEVRLGRFTAELQREVASGYARLRQARADARRHPLERSFEKLGPKA